MGHRAPIGLLNIVLSGSLNGSLGQKLFILIGELLRIILVNADRALLTLEIELLLVQVYLFDQLPFHFFLIILCEIFSLVDILKLSIDVANVTRYNSRILFKVVVLKAVK